MKHSKDIWAKRKLGETAKGSDLQNWGAQNDMDNSRGTGSLRRPIQRWLATTWELAQNIVRYEIKPASFRLYATEKKAENNDVWTAYLHY